MDARVIVTRGVSAGLRLGRGTAEKVATVAVPRLARLSVGLLPRGRRGPRATTTTFTPSPAPTVEPAAPRAAEPVTSTTRTGGPTPATVAHNIAPPRPSARPPQPAKPRSAPGAKLPPPRPGAS